MTEETTETTETTENEPQGISEEELRGMIGTTLDEKLNERGITSETLEKLGKLDILDSLEGLFETHKGSSVDEKGLLDQIGTMIDDKLKGIPSGGSGGGNGASERKPKLRIFS